MSEGERVVLTEFPKGTITQDGDYFVHDGRLIPYMCLDRPSLGPLYRRIPDPVPQLEARLQRAMDLIRYCRAKLHDANLIDDKEYVALLQMGPESVARLEGYDRAQARIAELEGELKRREDRIEHLHREHSRREQERNAVRRTPTPAAAKEQ